VKVALTIAGSDSGGGAGLQADIKTFAALGVHGASVVTAVTAQDSERVRGIFPLEASVVTAQLEAVCRDLTVSAVKTGMLATEPILKAVAKGLSDFGLRTVVVDPVMRASGGESLFEGAFEALLPLAFILTPNLSEAEAFLGHAVEGVSGMKKAARELRELGPAIVVLKGGHLPDDPVDVYWDGTTIEELRGSRVQGLRTHGTGCVFSAAIAAGLALGRPPLDAVRNAKAHLQAALEASFRLGSRDYLGSASNESSESRW
jgi:hydroxymethylpyrimidine/phosphomethylpyrimidine kinase